MTATSLPGRLFLQGFATALQGFANIQTQKALAEGSSSVEQSVIHFIPEAWWLCAGQLCVPEEMTL